REFALPNDGVTRHQIQDLFGGAQAGWLGGVVAAEPRRIVADCINDRAPPHTIATRNLRWQAGERHQRAHELWVLLSPEPRVHAAHRGPHHEAQMVDVEALSNEAVLGFDHIQIPVTRKLRAQSIARFTRLAVTDVVRKNDEVARGVDESSLGE